MSKETKVEVKYLGYSSEFEPPKPLPFGAHKYVRALYPDRVDNLGTLLSTTFTCALVKNGIEGEPFQYTKVY